MTLAAELGETGPLAITFFGYAWAVVIVGAVMITLLLLGGMIATTS